MLKDEIAKLSATTRSRQILEFDKHLAQAILDLPHPGLNCTIGQALERMTAIVDFINETLPSLNFTVDGKPESQKIRRK